MHSTAKKGEPTLIKWGRRKGKQSQNLVDIFGDMECFGCGCQCLVDPQTGEGIVQYLCERHRQLPYYMIRQMK